MFVECDWDLQQKNRLLLILALIQNGFPLLSDNIAAWPISAK